MFVRRINQSLFVFPLLHVPLNVNEWYFDIAIEKWSHLVKWEKRNKPALVALVDILSTVAADSRISIHRSTTTRALKSFRWGLRDNPTQIRREVPFISKSVMRTSVVTKRKKVVKSVPGSSRRNQRTQSLSYRLLLAVENQPAKEKEQHRRNRNLHRRYLTLEK